MIKKMASSADGHESKLAEERLQQIEKKLADRSAKVLAWIAIGIAAGSLAVAIFKYRKGRISMLIPLLEVYDE